MSIESLGGAQSRTPVIAPQQCAGAVLMIRPAAFDYNPETALTNKMQQPDEHARGSQGAGATVGAGASGTTDARESATVNAHPGATVQAQARAEFDGLVKALGS